MAHAVADVIAHHLELDLFQRRAHGRDLGHDVDAVAILVDHADEAAHLALDPSEPLAAGCPGLIAHD